MPDRLVWFLPHVFVTSNAASIAGREVHGFPESVVQVEERHTGLALDHLVVSGETMARHRPGAAARVRPILEITRSDAPAVPLRSVSDVLTDLARPLGAPAAWPAKAARRLATNELTFVFLKQLRDAQRPDRARYQAIVEAKAKVRALRGHGPLPGKLHVSWGDHDSHPFAAGLGLSPGGQDAAFAAWVDFDFVMERGREVFRA